MVPLAARKQLRHRQTNNYSTTDIVSSSPSPTQPQQQMNPSSSSRGVTGKAIKVQIQPLTRKNKNKSKSTSTNKSTGRNNSQSSAMSSAGWRRYGIERRRLLIDQDIREGGNNFDLNYQCRIQGYFALSEKVGFCRKCSFLVNQRITCCFSHNVLS